MPNNVTPLFRCGGCGKRGAPVELECDGDVTALTICNKCYKRHRKSLKKVRPVWKRMRKIGVPKEIASEVMGFLLDRWPDPDPPTPEDTDDAG